ncbi:MAG: tetratricopeptide repeat protein [Bacteroidales bacterium]|nr:tetratricopeptide repeat protein [Bacteroidales bacterium]
MKKIFLVLAIAASMQVAGAQNQVKSIAQATSAVEKAAAAAGNPKQNTKSATWMKYGQALIDAYVAPTGNVWIGIGKQELALIGGPEKPLSEEQVTLNGQPMVKQVYANKNYYFNQNGQLALVEVTKPIVPDALEKAVDAFSKANELDAGGQQTAAISKALKTINEKFIDEAYTSYTKGDYAAASVMFENAAKALGTAPLSQVDTNSIYNVAFTAYAAQNFDRAKEFYNKSISYGYAGDDGDAYARLASIAEKEGNLAESKSILEEGFMKYPQGQGILVALINYYAANGEDTSRLFELLDNAKKNEPNNPSLYSMEGNIHEKLGEYDEAVKAYEKCAEIDPTYEHGYIGLGLHYYNRAVDIQEKAANELDDAKYMVLQADFEKNLKACIEPFEKAYELTKNEETKSGVAEYLKNACFRFRDQDPSYMEKYKKYSGN